MRNAESALNPREREEGSSGHFQCELQLAGTELPPNPGFGRKYYLRRFDVFLSVNSPVIFNQFKNREKFEKDCLPLICES